jgi:hypothetical protein
MPNPFTINAQYVLLTYAQCDGLSSGAIVGVIEGLQGQCIIGRERHEDNGLHYHVFCDFGRKFRSRKTDVFDVDGFHPNIVPSKGTPWKGWDYAVKDGDTVGGTLVRPREGGVRNGGTHDKWTEITSAECREEFWRLVHSLDPKSAACSFSQLSKYCDWKYAVPEPVYQSPAGIGFDGGEVDGRHDWLLQSGIGSEQSFLGMSCPSLCYVGGGPRGGHPTPPGLAARGRRFQSLTWVR